MKKMDLFRLRIDGWIQSGADYLKGRMNSVNVGRRKSLLIVIFVVALVFLIGQTVVAFMKLGNNI